MFHMQELRKLIPVSSQVNYYDYRVNLQPYLTLKLVTRQNNNTADKLA